MVHPPPGVSRDHMGNLDFHSHLEGRRNPPLSHWSDVRGGLAESPDFHHHLVVTRPPTHVVSGNFVGSNKEAPLFLLARVVHRGPVRKEPELPPQPCSNEKPSLPGVNAGQWRTWISTHASKKAGHTPLLPARVTSSQLKQKT